MEIYVNSLIVEVTRRCNMECPHCIRGDARRKDISPEIIDETFRQTDGLGCIVPTGGEPFLVPDLTAKVLRLAAEKGATGFFVATNGTVSPFSEGGAKVLRAACEIDRPDSETSWFRVSDPFHTGLPAREWDMIACVEKDRSVYKPISRGRAEYATLFETRDDDIRLPCFELTRSHLPGIMFELLYVNALGDVYSDCDLSYEMQKDLKRKGHEAYLGPIDRLRRTASELVGESVRMSA
jgi:hypothetical protein